MNMRTANNSASVQQFDIAVVPRTPLKASYIALAIALLSPSSVCVEESNRMSVLFWKDTNDDHIFSLQQARALISFFGKDVY